jgi:hypothetical protein
LAIPLPDPINELAIAFAARILKRASAISDLRQKAELSLASFWLVCPQPFEIIVYYFLAMADGAGYGPTRRESLSFTQFLTQLVF